jgi:hypothetical protein
MLALSIDNLLFFLLIAIAALFQVLSKAVSKAGKSGSDETVQSSKPQPLPPIRRAPADSDAERIRKFLEALGQPASSSPPPPVTPRTSVPPRPLAPVQPPLARAWERTRVELPKPIVTRRESPPSEPPKRMEQIAPAAVPTRAAMLFEVHEETAPIELQQPPIMRAPIKNSAAANQAPTKRAEVKMDIATFLASKPTLREAILLREILGPPRGLQQFDLITI